MNRVNTYELAKEISDVLASKPDKAKMEEEYRMLSCTCLSIEAQRQALIRAIEAKCSNELQEEIFELTDQLYEEYDWRYTTDEMKEKLKEYNCNNPLVILADSKKAMLYMEHGYIVWALKKDGTSTLCESEADIKQAEENGCLLTTNQFAVEDVMAHIAAGDK